MTNMCIRGDIGYLGWGGEPYPCIIDKEKKTITVRYYTWDKSDSVYSYDFVNGQLVLNTDNNNSFQDTITFVPDEEAYVIADKPSLDGSWTDRNMISISVEGEAGVLNWGGEDYKCVIDQSNKKITAKGFCWSRGDVEYNYNIINGRLLLDSGNFDSFAETIVLIPTEDAEKMDKAEQEQEAKEQKEKEQAKKNAKPSIEGAKELSEGFFIIGEDIEPGIYDFGPVYDEAGDPYFSVDVYENKEYYDQGEGDAEGTDYINHYESYYGEEVKRGISLKKEMCLSLIMKVFFTRNNKQDVIGWNKGCGCFRSLLVAVIISYYLRSSMVR